MFAHEFCFSDSGLSRDQTIDAVSQAWVDGQSLRTYRHAPNTGSRKSWAAGDACSRAVNLALMVKRGEMGLPSVLTAKGWGFYDVLFKVHIILLVISYWLLGCCLTPYAPYSLPTGEALRIPTSLQLLHYGECSLQNILSRRIPRPKRRGSCTKDQPNAQGTGQIKR